MGRPKSELMFGQGQWRRMEDLQSMSLHGQGQRVRKDLMDGSPFMGSGTPGRVSQLS